MLPTPTVTIEQAPEVPAEIRDAVVEGCIRGLGDGACTASGQPLHKDADYQVELRWSDDNQRVTMIVRGTQWRLERELRFPPQDEPGDRGTAVGLVAAGTVATHFSFQPEPPPEVEPASPSEPEEPATTKADAPPSSSPEPPTPLRLRTDAALYVGSSLRDGPLALGFTGRASLNGWLDPVFPLVALNYSQSGGAVSARRWRSWLGLGVELNSSRVPLTVEISGACVGERLAVTATRGDDEERGAALRLGPLLQTDVVWTASEHIHYFLGGQASLLWPHVDITAARQPVDRQEVFGWGALSGIRLSL